MNNLEQEINVTLSNKVKKIKELYQIFDEIIFDLIKYLHSINKLLDVNIDSFYNHFKEKYISFIDFYDQYELNIIHFLSDYTSNKKEHKIQMYDNIKLYLFSNNIYEHFLDYLIFIKFNIDKFLNKPFFIKNNISLLTLDNIKDSNINLNEINDTKSLFPYIYKLIQQIDNISLDRKLIKIDFNKCEKCNIIMSVQKNNSELYCNKCGNIKTLVGIVFEDSHFYSQEGNRYKYGSYNPIRHCKAWLENIQAKDNIDISSTIIENIQNKIKRDKIINLKNITYNEYRSYLKDLGYTKYNNYIPLIRKHISNTIPIQLTNDEELLIIKYFEICIRNYNDIKTKDKKNIIQYGFLIYKLIEILITDYEKKKSLLSSIHLQEPSTLFENDKYWKQICKINKFQFYPTDKNKYL